MFPSELMARPTLQKWESAAKSNKRARQEESEGLQDSSALTALKQWASVPKKAREAMKRCTPEIVETLEMPIIEFVDKVVLHLQCHTMQRHNAH